MKHTKQIKYRSPYNCPQLELESLRKIMKKQERFKRKCDHEIRRLQKLGISPDKASEYLNKLVERYGSLLEIETKRIFEKNLNSIDNVYKRRRADRTEYEEMLRVVQEQLSTKIVEYERLEELYKQSNPLENGRLNLSPIQSGEMEKEGKL